MTTGSKKAIKVVALTVGIILVVGGISFLIYLKWKKNQEEPEEKEVKNPYVKTSSSGSHYSSTSSSKYSTEQIKRMQRYLLLRGQMVSSEYILSRISDTGGVDGKMGSGFNDALKEAIKLKIVKDLTDLHVKAEENYN